MISTLQKLLQYAAISLVGPSSSSLTGSHIGHDKLVSEPRPTIGSPLIDRSLAIVESSRKTILESSYIGDQEFFLLLFPFVALVRNCGVGVLILSLFPFKKFLQDHIGVFCLCQSFSIGALLFKLFHTGAVEEPEDSFVSSIPSCICFSHPTPFSSRTQIS